MTAALIADISTNRAQRRSLKQRRRLEVVPRPNANKARATASATGRPVPQSPSGTLVTVTSLGMSGTPLLTAEQAVVLNLFGRPPVAYHRQFVDLAGSVTAALWLSHAIELAQTGGQPDVALTQAACSEATGLTRREQETARAKLRAAGLITERRAGRQVLVHLHLHAIAERLLAVCQAMPPYAIASGLTEEAGQDARQPQRA
jgi:hypothetical protein